MVWSLGPERAHTDLARAPGIVFRARLTAASAPAPEAGPPFREAVRVGEWEVLRSRSSN